MQGFVFVFGKVCLYYNVPVCVLVWRLRSNVSLNPFPQNVHKYRLTSLWHFICLFNSRCKPNVLEQTLHTNLLGGGGGSQEN